MELEGAKLGISVARDQYMASQQRQQPDKKPPKGKGK
jgi:hypothetical protein